MRAQRCVYGVGLALWLGAGCGGLSGQDESAGVEAGRASGMAGTGSGGGLAMPQSTTGIPRTVTPPAVPPETADMPPTALRVPAKHRAASVACDNERVPGSARPYYDETYPPCSDAGACEPPSDCPNCLMECVDFGTPPRRCVVGYGECLGDADCTAGVNGRCDNNRGSFFCTYDTCFADGTCTSGGPCACEGESGSPGNTCLPGNCKTDADCGGETGSNARVSGYCSPTFGTCGNYSGVIAYYCHTAGDRCVDDADCVDPMQGAGYCMYSPERGHWTCGYGQCVG